MYAIRSYYGNLKKAILIAYQLKDYLDASEVSIEKSFTLNINDRDYHTTVFNFLHQILGICKAEITIPVLHDRLHRIWTKNQYNKFVWSTMVV